MHVFSAVLFFNFPGDVLQGQFAQVDGIRTHIGNVSGFVKVLRHRHGAVHGKAEFATGFLLQGRSGKRIRWRALLGFYLDVADAERSAFALQQKGFGVFLLVETFRGFGFQLHDFALLVFDVEDGGDLMIRSHLEALDFAFAFHDELHGHRLHTPGRKAAFDFFPEDSRQFVAHKPVKHPARLLRIH